MKKLCSYNNSFWVISILSLILSGNMCFGTEQENAATIEKQVKETEELWKAGKTNEYFLKAREIAKKINPHMNITYTEEQYEDANRLRKAGKTNEYYAKIEEFKKEFLSHSITGNLNKIAAELFDNIMSKKANIIDSGNNDLYAMDDLVSYLFSNDKVSIKERQVNALLLCRFLGKIRKEIIPNYKDKLVLVNIGPPLGVPGESGMDPKAITNPVLRAQYETAIRENEENGLMNSRQYALISVGNKVISTRIIDYIIKTFRGDDASLDLLAECIKAADLTDKEKEEVFKKVGIKQLKQSKTSGTAVQGQQNIK